MVGGMGHEEEEGRFVTTMMSIKVMVMTIVYHGTTVCLTKHHERAGDILCYHSLWEAIVTLISGSIMII